MKERASLDSDPLAGVPREMWPLLQRAEAANPTFGWQEIAAGIASWRWALERGKVWSDDQGAHWPEPELRKLWAETLEEMELPRFTKRYPELVDLLLFRLLEMAVQLAEAPFGASSDESSARGEAPQASASSKAGGESSPDGEDGEGEGGKLQQQAQERSAEDAPTDGEEPPDESESLLQRLVDEFQDEWGHTVEALGEAEESFGRGGARDFASSFTSEGAPWRQSGGWEMATQLREVIKKMPSLRELVRSLGRRTALRGPKRRLPVEIERLGGLGGVARSDRAPTETSGLKRTGSWEVMLPGEAHLLVRGRERPCLRALHHARRVEEALIGYDRSSWLDVPSQQLRSEEGRPADENGPIIVCLDTSGSMARYGGAPETVAKALVYECLRQAHKKARRCCLFAFSAGEALQELDLDLSADGLERLLEFLQYAFHGGTSLEEVLRASVERLESSRDWRNADILLVTDGEVPKPTGDIMEALKTAKEQFGVCIYGIVVGPKAGRVMATLCSELYKVASRAERKANDESPMDPTDWKLRCIQGRGASLAMASRAPPSPTPTPRGRASFAGGTPAGCLRGHPRAACSPHVRRCQFQQMEMEESPVLREAQLEGEDRSGESAAEQAAREAAAEQAAREAAAEQAAREARWRERAEAKERERQQAMKAKMEKGWRWIGGKWVTRAASQAQDEKIEILYQEARLQNARLEVQLRMRAEPASHSAEALAADEVAANWACEHLENYGEELLTTLLSASRAAASLGQVCFSSEAVLLGLLATSEGAELCCQGLPPSIYGRDRAEVVRGAVESVVRLEQLEAPRTHRGPDLPFTKTLRRLLEAVEAERARLGHEEAVPAHLLLTLTSETFAGGAVGALQELGVDPRQLRLRALRSLGDFLATAQCNAEAWLLRRCAKARAAVEARPCGRPVQGLGSAFAAITDSLMERSVEAKLMLLAALSGEHLFLLGSPGTAKSLVARRLSKVCAGSFFERLLTRFSVPEEIFGPLSLQALEQDELRRKTRGYLPECDVAFIDEIFKANSSILNTLLMVLNDRLFDNGDVRTRVPLWCVVAASNELPDTDELDALYDRFLLRRCVRRISPEAVSDFLRLALDTDISATAEEPAAASSGAAGGGGEPSAPALSAQISADLRERARRVEFPEALLQIVAELREHLADEAEPPFVVSDRRLAKAVRLVRVAAAAVGAPRVVESDLLLLRHMFWDRNPEQSELVSQWLLQRFTEDNFGQKAWTFLLEGLKKRLRVGLAGASLDAARRDLASLRESATNALGVALRVAQDAPGIAPARADGEGVVVDRYFWLEDEERSEMVEVGHQASKGAEALGELLTEAAVLSEVAGLEDAVMREELLKQILGFAVEEEEDQEPETDEWGDLL